MKKLDRTELASLLAILVVILGAFLRFSPTVLSGFAVNDGGMFAVMVEDLKASGYALPVFTSYNGLNLPYAYPPLGFYLGRITADLLRLPGAEVVRWLPAFFSSLSVPVFFGLAQKLLKTRFHAALAALMFATMPSVISWFIMGGGLTRSLGQFFMLLTLNSAVTLYRGGQKRQILVVAAWGALTVLSHPEAAIHTAVAAFFFWAMLGRSRASWWHSVQVAGLVLLFTAPWWGLILFRHGLAPFLSAAGTGSLPLAAVFLVFFSFSGEMYATVIAVLGLVGIGSCFARRDYFLPLWLALPFVVEGRSAVALAILPLAMLAAGGFLDIILPGLRAVSKTEAPAEKLAGIESGALLYLSLYLLLSAYLFGLQFMNTSLTVSNREAMRWVREETETTARFLVLTGSRAAACDSVAEWFPALAQRQSLLTVQGNEWILGKEFGGFVRRSAQIQACVMANDQCLLNQTQSLTYDYIYLSKKLSMENCSPLPGGKTFPFLTETLRANPRFAVVYETEDVVIYQGK